MVATALPLPPQLTVIDGGRTAGHSIEPRHLVEIEGAWIEVQVVAHEADTFADLVLIAARRIQVAIAGERFGMAGQYAHDLELAAPMYAHRARRAELEAKRAIDRLHPEPVA